jgi:GNAT superfamily N-acetyltransferase
MSSVYAMPDVITVRPAEPGDGDILGEIHALSWGVSHGPFCTPKVAAAGIEERRTKWHGIPAEGADTILLARLNERPGAFAHPDVWGSGIASALLTAVLDRVRDAGYDYVHLWTLRDSAQARRFYAKNGFAATGRTHDHHFDEGPPVALVELERAVPGR